MMIRATTCVLWLIVGVLPAMAGPAEIVTLMDRLTDAQWEVREAASHDLVELGDEALPRLLQLASGHGDPEVQTLARNAVRRIGEERRSGPTRVTLHLKDVTAAQALAELEKQAGVAITLSPADLGDRLGNPVSLDIHREPFWMAMRLLSARTGLSPDRHGQGQIILRQNGDRFWQKPFCQHGGFITVADDATLVVSSDLGGAGRDARQLSLRLRLFVDPKLRVAYAPGQFHIRQAVDDQGVSLLPQSGVGMMHSASHGTNWIWDLVAHLPAPKGGTRLAKFHGEARLGILSKVKAWELDRILSVKDAERTSPAGAHTVRELRRTAAGYELRVAVEATPHHLLNEFSAVQRSLKLVDEHGRAYTPAGGMGGGGDGKLEYTFRFAEPEEGSLGPPAKLTWAIPLELSEVSVPIRFNDLPLPVP